MASQKKYGKCILCNKRVKGDHISVTTKDGYAHRSCLNRRFGFASA